jgi:hypothetical protein
MLLKLTYSLMSIARIILQMNPWVLTKSTRILFFKEILLTNPEGFKIFMIRSKLHKNPSKFHLNFNIYIYIYT